MKETDKTPLTDIWLIYTESLDVAIKTGNIDDQKLAEVYVWPRELNITLVEREDIKRYVHDRVCEIVDKSEIPLDQNIVASYIFRSIICGMLLSKQKRANE